MNLDVGDFDPLYYKCIDHSFRTNPPRPSRRSRRHVSRNVGISQTTRRQIGGNINSNVRHTFLSAINFAKASYTISWDGRWISGKATWSAARIRSRTAACPDDVRSKITQHKASGSGVNWPWGSGWTRQSSTSPEGERQQITVIIVYFNLQMTVLIICNSLQNISDS